MEFRLGRKAVLYVGTAGSTPATAVGKAVSHNLKITKKEADCTVREDDGNDNIKPDGKQYSLSWEMKVKKDDSVLATIQDAFWNDTPIAMMPLNGPVGDGGKGVDADWNIFEYDEKDDLEGCVIATFSAKTDNDLRLPQRV